MNQEPYRRACQKEALATVGSRYKDHSETNLSMCTGAGKTFVIVDVCHLPGVNRVVLVFPSLLLIQQFYRDHKGSFSNMFYFATEGTLRSGAHVIRRISAAFIELAFDTVTILTTYVSAPLLLAALTEEKQLDMLIADEAHHITAPVYSAAYARAAPFIRHTVNFSATLPDAKEPHYKYPLLKGIRDGVVRDFNIELFLCKSGEETGLLQMIDKLIALHEGKAKILIYTAEANTDGSSVRTFMARYSAMVKARGWWIEGINADTLDKDRDPLLRAFEADKSPASILVSCRTLSEGIDLKNANCMLPWDPSASVKDNIQRIGRVVRLYKTTVGAVAASQPPSTILIPVFVEEADYTACSGDRAAVHALLEKQIGEGEKGNFRPIVNVCTALKSELAEEDSDLFNQLLDTQFTTNPKVRVDRDLVSCVAAQLKKPVEDVLEEVAAALTEKGELEEETIDAIREGDISVEDAGAVATALAESQEIRLIIRDKDEEEVVGNGSKEIIVERKGSVYTASKKKKSDSAAAAARQRVAHRLRASFSDGCKILLGLEAVDLEQTEGLVLARLTAEVQYDEDWEKRRLEWVAAYEKLGKRPSHGSKDPEIKKAGNWQNTQRQSYKKKELYMTTERISVLESTKGWKWDEDDSWELNRLHWLSQFQKLGRKPSDTSNTLEEKRAGQWQSDQRKSYIKKESRMTVERIAALNATPGWKWEEDDKWGPNRRNWITQYQKLGRTPSQIGKTIAEKQAGRWQVTQRVNYKKKESCMTSERIAILDATPGWKWEEEDSWEPNRLHWIVQYHKLGKKPSEDSKDSDEKKAGIWQAVQRREYKSKKVWMTADRIATLNATKGWAWESEDSWEPNRQNWIAQYQKLKKNLSDHLQDPDEKKAAKWQQHQRDNYKNKETCMTPERIAILNTTEGWKWEEDDTFEPNLQNWIVQYIKLGRKPSEDSKDSDEKKAGKWQSHRRQDYKKKESYMTAERIAKLEATEGWTWEKEDSWEPNRLYWLSQYIKLGKNPSGMSKNSDEKRAGKWHQSQRRDYKKKETRMTPERIAALNATPGWSWSADSPPITPALTVGDVIEHVNDDDVEVEGPERKRHIPTGEGTSAGSQDRARSQLELLHKAYKTRNAETYFSLMQTDPAKFAEYHAVADMHDARDPPERKPQNRIAEMLKKNNRASYKAVDLGCGRNALRADERVAKMTWTSVDVVAADPTVTVADMGALPFEDESFDIAILNRSLWAKNHAVVLSEVWRILKEGGRAILCESFQRWFSDGENELLTALKGAGFTVISEEGTTPDSSVSVFQYIEVRKD